MQLISDQYLSTLQRIKAFIFNNQIISRWSDSRLGGGGGHMTTHDAVIPQISHYVSSASQTTKMAATSPFPPTVLKQGCQS